MPGPGHQYENDLFLTWQPEASPGTTLPVRASPVPADTSLAVCAVGPTTMKLQPEMQPGLKCRFLEEIKHQRTLCDL